MSVMNFIEQSEAELRNAFAEIDRNEEIRTRQVLDLFRKHGVSYRHFAPSTGYGYDDIGRDTLEKIYAENPFPLLSVDEYIKITAEIIAKLPRDLVLFRLFTTAPAEYLIAPKWNLGTQEALRKFEEYLDANHITQGCQRCME